MFKWDNWGPEERSNFPKLLSQNWNLNCLFPEPVTLTSLLYPSSIRTGNERPAHHQTSLSSHAKCWKTTNGIYQTWREQVVMQSHFLSYGKSRKDVVNQVCNDKNKSIVHSSKDYLKMYSGQPRGGRKKGRKRNVREGGRLLGFRVLSVPFTRFSSWHFPNQVNIFLINQFVSYTLSFSRHSLHEHVNPDSENQILMAGVIRDHNITIFSLPNKYIFVKWIVLFA